MQNFKNPILPGFYPDPSVCRVGEDYYLVNSTFAYFPGIPVFHSRDLVHWKQLCYAMDRPSQLNLDGLGHSDGIYAPTIRYNNGTFYIICTNVGSIGNFIITAKNPSGPWSDPYVLNNAPGIDPSLFFDENGKAYYTGTADVPGGGEYYGDNEIWLKELDLATMQLTGERYGLWRGALKHAMWSEGPHLYRIGGYYYLMIAEGGTDYYHSVTIARSTSLKGPYEGNPANPILTHRHLGRSYPVANTGHAELIETQNGEWWMVALASRPYGGHYRNLGRETFLMPVAWEDGWPIVSPGTGRIEMSYTVPNLSGLTTGEAGSCEDSTTGSTTGNPRPGCSPITYDPAASYTSDDFDKPALSLVWNMLRTPREEFWSLNERAGFLRLKLRPQMLSEEVNPSFIGRRQQHIDFTAVVSMEFEPENVSESAGIVLIQNNDYHFRIEYAMRTIASKKHAASERYAVNERSTMNERPAANEKVVRLIKREAEAEETLAEQPFSASPLYLRVSAKGQDYSFYYGSTAEADKLLFGNADGRILSTDKAGGFVGTYIGMYASSNGTKSSNHADFDWFSYKGE